MCRSVFACMYVCVPHVARRGHWFPYTCSGSYGQLWVAMSVLGTGPRPCAGALLSHHSSPWPFFPFETISCSAVIFVQKSLLSHHFKSSTKRWLVTAREKGEARQCLFLTYKATGKSSCMLRPHSCSRRFSASCHQAQNACLCLKCCDHKPASSCPARVALGTPLRASNRLGEPPVHWATPAALFGHLKLPYVVCLS